MESVVEREARLKKIALDLYGRCKSENLTVGEFNRTMEILKVTVANQTKI